MPPCPRIYDQIGDAPGLVMEWCPLDMEEWWASVMNAPEGFRALCQSLSEICRRLAEYSTFAREQDTATPVIIHPRTLLRRGDGRWLLSRFGSPSRIDAEGCSTKIIAEPDGFLSPEVLFDATPNHQPASECWSIGCVLLALLQMRVFSGSGMPLPPQGTAAHHFRSHRVNLVIDLYQRKPGLFLERALDARQFLYPDRIPDPDRQVVEKATEGLFGTPQPDLEAQLSGRILRILDKALSIEPSARHTDPIELANELELLGRWFRETAQSIKKSRPEPAAPVHTRVVEGPKRSKTDEALDAMKASIAEHSALAARVTAGNAALTAQLARAEEDARGARQMLWGAIGLLAAAQVVLAVLLLPAGPTDALPPPPAAVNAPASPAGSMPVPPPAEEAEAAEASIVEAEEEAEAAEASIEETKETGPAEASAEEPGAVSVEEIPQPSTGVDVLTSTDPTELPPAAEPDPVSALGRITIDGAAGWLVGPSGRVAPGAHPAGDYEVMVTIDDAPLSLGWVTLTAGADVKFRCGFGNCKRIP